MSEEKNIVMIKNGVDKPVLLNKTLTKAFKQVRLPFFQLGNFGSRHIIFKT